MDFLVRDIRFAFRSLVRHRGLSVVAILRMGLGIGVCVTLFATVNPWLFRPLPYLHPERLVGIQETSPRGGSGAYDQASAANYVDWRASTRSFEGMGAYERAGLNLSTENEPVRVHAARVSERVFPTLGVAPVLGRGFAPNEDLPSGARVALLAHGLWQERFDGDAGVLGRQVVLDGVSHTIVGVLPKGFAFPEYAEVWTPLGLAPSGEDRASRRLEVVARLAPGVSVEQAQEELSAVAAALERDHPEANRARGARVKPLLEWLTPPGVAAALRLMLAAGLLVQLIACANVANLLLAKATAERQETALRLALGAGRGRLLRHALTEGLLLSLAGGGLGLLLAVWGVNGLTGGTPVRPPFWVVHDLDVRGFAFTAGLTALSALLVTLAPVWQARKADVLGALKDGARNLAGGPRGRLGRALVVTELGFSLVLLIGAALLVQSFRHRYDADSGLETRGVLTARLTLSGDAYAQPESRATLLEELLRRLRARPEVVEAGATDSLPFPDPLGGMGATRSFEVEGKPAEPGHEPSALYCTTTTGYLRTIGLPLADGRFFSGEEEAQGRDVAVVSDGMARRLWGGDTSVIGQRLRLSGGPWLEVVGLVHELSDSGDILWTGGRPAGQIYVPYRREPVATVSLVVRTRTEPALFAGALRDELRALEPTVPLESVFSLDEVRLRALWVSQTWGRMLSVVAGLALVLAALGVYGVVSYTVSQRAQEIGVRMAVGARPIQVLRLVLGQGLGLALRAAVVGLLGAVALARALSGLLFGIDPLDPATFVAGTLLLGFTAILASYLPARRATRVDPLAALRAS